MCVNKDKSKCKICHMTFTQATVCIGGLYLISGVTAAIMGLWGSFGFNIAIALLLGLVVCMPENVLLRKIVFFGFTALQGAGLVTVLSIAVYIGASGWNTTWCDKFNDDYSFSSIDACESYLTTNVGVTLGIVVVLGSAFTFMAS